MEPLYMVQSFDTSLYGLQVSKSTYLCETLYC